jgi:hypothetical protein
MFAQLAERAVDKIEREELPVSASYWLAVHDQNGFECSAVDEIQALHTLVEQPGVVVAGSVTFYREVTGEPALLAYVVSQEAEDSDVRRASIRARPGEAPLGDWERTV